MKKTFPRAAFSLVEVTMALGIVSFALLSVAGLLPVALKTVKDSTVEVSMANIAQQVRSDLIQTPFASLSNFSGTTSYYLADGVKAASSRGAYFNATFSVTDPAVPGATTSYPANAKIVKVTVRYPEGVTAASQQTNIFSILTAKQNSAN